MNYVKEIDTMKTSWEQFTELYSFLRKGPPKGDTKTLLPKIFLDGDLSFRITSNWVQQIYNDAKIWLCSSLAHVILFPEKRFMWLKTIPWLVFFSSQHHGWVFFSRLVESNDLISFSLCSSWTDELCDRNISSSYNLLMESLTWKWNCEHFHAF